MSAEFAIVGAGVMGCALARELARRGRDVLVLERSIPGAEASSAAGGILGAQSEAHGPGPFLDLALYSRARWSELASELASEGHDVGFSRSGLLKLAIAPEDRAWLDEVEAWQRAAGLPVERLADASTRQPGAPSVPALFFEDDGVVDAQLLPAALAASARRAGARIVCGGNVLGLAEGGLETSEGFVAAQKVVVCAGAWTARVPGLLPKGAVEPVRGQVLVLQGQPGRLRQVTFTRLGYLIPRADGRVLIGSTTEHAGFDKRVTPEGRETLTAIARTALPELADAAVLDHWAGFRPGTPDDLPLLGPTHREGVHVLSGHYRNGILLTPGSARLMAQQLCGEEPDIDLAPYDPRRLS
ncbi:MAG: glycine oxidase ThiO [Proteobacteria bacterium]|nr:glycine oxidase ThiO [Pseudomonadota bacterium]